MEPVEGGEVSAGQVGVRWEPPSAATQQPDFLSSMPTVHDRDYDALLICSIREVTQRLLCGPALVAALTLSFADEASRMNGIAHTSEEGAKGLDQVCRFGRGLVFGGLHGQVDLSAVSLDWRGQSYDRPIVRGSVQQHQRVKPELLRCLGGYVAPLCTLG